MFLRLSQNVFMTILLLVSLKICCPANEGRNTMFLNIDPHKIQLNDSIPSVLIVDRNITIAEYFQFLDSIVQKYKDIMAYPLTEHVLVRANPWIIDTLQNTDYYRMITRDIFVYDQKNLIVLNKGSKIIIPDVIKASRILASFQRTIIDINIPEFKLRILEDSIAHFEFSVRVGRNEKKYLKMGDRITDLKTKIGNGSIVAHVRNPSYFNPVNGHQYFVTKRDDNKTTVLPQIPFIETEINGIRNGQLIHPTTNPITLGKAYSNGCIGTKEADAWVIYYYAPIGTKINIKYNLNSTNKEGKEITLDNIYNLKL